MRCLLIVLLLACLCATAQQNLVPNGDFEEKTECPSGINTFSSLKYWLPCGSPDYYHTCCQMGCTIPENLVGNQMPKNGNAYSGIGIYRSDVSNLREYLKIKLSKKINDSCYYYFKMYFSIASYVKFFSLNIGCLITNQEIDCDFNNYSIIQMSPQISNDNLSISDSSMSKWYELSYISKFNKDAEWLYIGNFNCDSQTITIANPNGNEIATFAYLYVDNVQLYNLCTDSNVINWQQVKLQIPSGITVNSDGLNDKLKLMNRSFFNSLKLNLYDRWGHLLYSTNDINFEWDGSYQGERVPIGVYQWQAEYTTIYDSRLQHATGNVTVLY